MTLQKTITTVRSGVFHVVSLGADGKRIASGTGFTALGLFFTNGHVYDLPPNTTHVWIRQDSDTSQTQGLCLDREDFLRRRVVASPKNEYDYAVLDIPELKRNSPHQFGFVQNYDHKIGAAVAFLGFPLEHQNVVCHSGIISSLYCNLKVDIIQVDASVNPSNSGGPLFNQDSGLVLGIVTRKATGLTEMFLELRKSINNNVRVINSMQGDVKIAGLSFKDVFMANQNQILGTLDQIERSSNVGIGYAFSIKHVIEDLRYRETMQ